MSIGGAAGAGGTFQAGDFVMLGDCLLGGMPADQQNITFFRNLTAAALDLGIAGSVGSGLLGSQFFSCFPSGVEFDWYGTDGDPPTVIFYKVLPDDAKKNAIRVPLLESFFGVPSITVNINGCYLNAIIDSGSPITILNENAAKEVGVEIKSLADGNDVQIKGVDDAVVGISRSSEGASITIGGIQLGTVKSVCVGDLPGLSFVSNFVSGGGPQVLLGLDALRRMYRMILTKDEVWFEPLPEKK